LQGEEITTNLPKRLGWRTKEKKDRPRTEHDLMCFFLLAIDSSQFVSQKKKKKKEKVWES
jgi:hypothetical protein